MSIHRIKLFVHKDNIVKLRCPNCHEKKQIPASVLKNKYKLRGRCKCNSVIEIDLEYRKTFRKETNLRGYYSDNLEELQSVKVDDGDLVTNITSTNCYIMNISTYGLGFKSLNHHNIINGAILYVIFQLLAGTIIDKKVIIRNVQGDNIGCEFIDVQEEDKDIGNYLL
jgi:hypothetical protein